MPLSAGQGGDTTLIKTGAHKITVGTQVVGFTTGNLQLTFSVSKRIRNVNEYGTTPVDEIVTGVQISVKFSIAERSLKTLDIGLNGLYPGNQGTATTNRGIGRSGVHTAQGIGQQITLHPISVTGTGEDIVLNKVMLAPTGNYQLDEQGDQILEVEGSCVIDTSQTDGSLLAIINTAAAGA